MAKACYQCAECGEDVAVIGCNRKEADRKAAWCTEQEHICSDCQSKQWEADNKKAVEDSKHLGLPELTGSEKQIAWASKIRLDKLKQLEEGLTKLLSNPVETYFGSKLEEKFGADTAKQVMLEYYDAANLIAQELRSETSSKKWIDNYRCSDMSAPSFIRYKIQASLDMLCPTLFNLIQERRNTKAED